MPPVTKRDFMCALQPSAVQCTNPTWDCYAARSEDFGCICFSTQSCGCIHVLIVQLKTLIASALAHSHVNAFMCLFVNLQCRSKMPRMVAAWLRCYVMVNIVYFLTGGMWAYYVYVCWGDKFFAPGNMPALRDMGEQIKVQNLNMLMSDSNSSWLRTICCKMCWSDWSECCLIWIGVVVCCTAGE